MRIGIGYDVHRLVENRPLILGGITIEYHLGLLGHSDADVLTHAIIDALLGAANLGDIGSWFPDNDQRYKDISSIELLRQVGQGLTQKGYQINNIDSTIVCQAPKLRPYINQMASCLAEALSISPQQISIKATTTEGLGFEGQKQGISSQAIALITKIL